MILWHLGLTAAAVRYVYRDPGMDLRWIALGSLLPDLIDKPIGSVFFHATFGAHRLFAHALVFPLVALAAVLVASRRGRARKALVAVVIGSLFHLLLDGVWTDPEAFLWPLFGWSFAAHPNSALLPLVAEMATDPLVWVGEAVGGAYLVYAWRRYLAEPGAWGDFVRDGTIPMPVGR